MVIGLALIKSWGIADSISRNVDIFSFTVLSILKRPILNWFSTNSPTDLTLLLPKWSMSSSPFPSRKSSMNFIIAIMSVGSKIVFELVFKSNFELSLTLPTSDKSYLSFLKYKLLKFHLLSPQRDFSGLKLYKYHLKHQFCFYFYLPLNFREYVGLIDWIYIYKIKLFFILCYNFIQLLLSYIKTCSNYISPFLSFMSLPKYFPIICSFGIAIDSKPFSLSFLQ